MRQTTKPAKKSVELGQSRIRREPVRTIEARPSRIRRDPVREEKEAFWRSREWEIRLSVAGITLFAIAISIIWIGVNHAMNY